MAGNKSFGKVHTLRYFVMLATYIIMKFLHDSGPEHMKPFAEDPEIISKFCGVTLSRSVLAKPPQPAGLWWQFKLWGPCIKPFLILLQFLEENPLVRNPIHLKFSNPEQYGSIVLYKLIPRIVNPTGNNVCHAACMSFHNVHSPNNVKFHHCKMSKLPNTNVQCCSDKLAATALYVVYLPLPGWWLLV